jgi:hypothetical protein
MGLCSVRSRPSRRQWWNVYVVDEIVGQDPNTILFTQIDLLGEIGIWSLLVSQLHRHVALIYQPTHSISE